MLRAAALAKLPLMSPKREPRFWLREKASNTSSMHQERWRMLQDYYLGSSDG